MPKNSGNKQKAKGGQAKAPAKKQKKVRSKRRYAMSRDERRAVRRRKIAVVVTIFLLLVIYALLAMTVGNRDYEATLFGWAPLIAYVAMLVLAFFYLQVLKRSIILQERSSMTDCRRDEAVPFRVFFRNKSPLFFFRMEAHFFTADLFGNPVNHAATTIALAPLESYDMPFITRFEHIGTYKAGLDRVVIYDFLRLFSATVSGPGTTQVHVTPKLVNVSGIEFSNDSIVETTKAARSAISDSMDYAAAREYVFGDPMKNVHWKLSARTEGLMTKLFETYTNPGVAIILDFYGPGQNATELMQMFDCVVETGFSVARFAQMQGMDTEIHYVDRMGKPVRRLTWRESDLPMFVSEMPSFSSQQEMAAPAIELLEQQIRSPQGQNNIVICTANLSAQMMETIASAKIRRREPHVFAVVPSRLEGRAREQYLAPLSRLDSAGISYTVLSTSTDLLKMGGRS